MALASGLWPSEAAIERILDATGRQFVPPDLDRGALSADLNQCRFEILAKQTDTAAYRKSHKKAAALISNRARALRLLLRSSGNGLFDRQLWFALDPGGHEQMFALLERIESEAARIAGVGIVIKEKGGGPKAYLIELLKPIYQRHIRKAGRTQYRDGAGIGGPFTRFVGAVGREMSRQLRVSGHTVDRAFRRPKPRVGKSLPRAD